MTEAPSHLIARPAGVIRVLRLVAQNGRCYPLFYDVPRGEPMCLECGCTEEYRCAGGCSWASEARDLCDRCYRKEMLL